TSGADFQAFAQYLGVDAVIIGSITDYDAYYPPRMSLKVNWYAANPNFHPVEVGYGLPWGTKQEKKIPQWVHYEAQRALAAEQLKTQTPVVAGDPPLMPEDRTAMGLNPLDPRGSSPGGDSIVLQEGQAWDENGAPLPPG